MDIANIQVEIAESNQKLKNCEKELIECKEKLNECKEKLKECLEAQNNSNNNEYFQNEESTYRRLKDLSPEKRLQTLQDEEKNVSARFTALEQTRAALEQTRAVLQGERLLVLQRSASNSEQGLFMNTEARHKSDQEMDSNLRFTRSGASSRLSYKGKDAIVGLCCPRDQKPSIELKDIEGYEDLWKQAEGDGLEFDEDGAMDDATRRRVKEALRKKFPHSFEQRYFGVSVEFLVQKHVRSLDGVGEMFLQQFVYNLFSGVLLSACSNAANYKADESVLSYLHGKCRESKLEDWKFCDFQFKPDAASTISEGCDAFATMELETSNSWRFDVLVDEEKSITLLCSTLISLERQGVDTLMLHFPFVIGNGLKAILYVVHFQQRPQEKKTVQNNATNDTEGKIPKVSSVGASEYNLGNDKDRTELFFALCVLLHNIKETFKKERDKISNYQNLCSGKQPEFENASFSRKRGQSSSRDTTSRKSSATKKRKSEANEENKKRNEDLAAQAASCNGLFCGIEFPWLRTIVDEEDSLTIKYQEKSPYYFHGMDVSTGRKCFLKVWREDKEGFVDART